VKILVIEDEHRIARAIKEGLEQDSYAVDVVYDGGDGYETARHGEYDLIILDIMLPGMNGFEVSKKLRSEKNHTPILMLTAKDQTKDTVRGFDSGADDYLTKPFSFEVLTARVRALLRRPHETLNTVLSVGDLTMDMAMHEVRRGGKLIKLSSKEYSILEYMMRHKNRVLSKDNIMSYVWDFDADVLPNNIEVFINYLRAKVDKPFDEPTLIQTVRGFGYKISDTETE